MKIFIFIYFNLPVLLFSQTIKIVNTKNVPVQYAHVIINNKDGVISDNEGIVNFNKPLVLQDTLLVSCIGYSDTTVIYNNIKKTKLITLNEHAYTLDAITITGNKLTKHEIVLGNKKHHSKFEFDKGVEVAYLIKPTRDNLLLKSVSYYIKKTGIPTQPFRVKLYYVDTTNGKPGKPLIDTNIIIHAQRGNSWVTYNFNRFIIIPKNGFFVSMECLPNAKRYREEKMEKGGTIVASGQVLGAKYKKKKENLVFSRWFPIKKWEWEHSNIPAITVKLEYYK